LSKENNETFATCHQLGLDAPCQCRRSDACLQRSRFSNVEWQIGHIKEYLETNSLDALKQLHAEHNLRCIGGFETELKAFSSAEECAANHDLLEDNARLLAALGGTNLVVGTDGWGQQKSYEEVVQVLADSLVKSRGASRHGRFLAHRIQLVAFCEVVAHGG
jgi:hypothetical protein